MSKMTLTPSQMVKNFLERNRAFGLEAERALLPWRDGVDGAYVAALVDVLEGASKSHKDEVDKLNELHNKEVSAKNRILREYQMNLEKVEEEFKKRNEELSATKKKELKKMVEEGHNDPERLSREIAQMFGLEHG